MPDHDVALEVAAYQRDRALDLARDALDLVDVLLPQIPPSVRRTWQWEQGAKTLRKLLAGLDPTETPDA